MAEGGKSPQPIVCNFNIIHEDTVGTKHDIRADEIGAVSASGGAGEPNARNAYEQQIVEGVEEMKLPKPSAFAKLKKYVAGKDRQQTDISAESLSPDPELHKVRGVRIGFLRERSRARLGQSEYIEAVPILEEILALEETANFDTCLLLAECCLHLGREIKANKAIQVVRDIIMTSQSFTTNDIYELGSELIANSSRIRGIILLRISADMYETNASTPDDVVNGIYSCIDKTHEATKPLIEAGGRSRVIGLDVGVENIIEMKQMLKVVKNATPGNKALNEAVSDNIIVFNLHLAKEYEKSVKYCQTGIEILERQFPSNAAKYQIYGRLLNNLGTAHDHLGKYSEAESYYVKAIEAKGKATDYSDESEKQKDIEMSKNNLKLTRAQLRK